MKFLLPALIAFLAPVLPLQAESVVDWSVGRFKVACDLVTEGATEQTAPGVHSFLLDESHSWVPPELANPAFGPFGLALSSSVGESPAVPHLMQVSQYRGRGLVQLLVRGSQSQPPAMRGVFFIAKEEFKSGMEAPGRKVAFTPASRITFKGVLDGKQPQARWLIRNGDSWHVSETTLSPQNESGVPENREITGLLTERWTELHPSHPPLARPQPEFVATSFDNITAVGIYWDSYEAEADIGGVSFTRFAVENLTFEQ